MAYTAQTGHAGSDSGLIRLGSSRFGAAIGIDQCSRAQLWRNIFFGEIVDPFTQRIYDYGHQHEADGVELAQIHAGDFFLYTGAEQRCFERGRYETHPDGLGQRSTLEVKARLPDFDPYEDVPAHFMPQIQTQMDLCGKFLGTFVGWHHREPRIWLVERSEEYLEKMWALVDGFMVWVDEEVPPPRLGRRPKMPEVITERIL